jgi:subtilase family serine protease
MFRRDGAPGLTSVLLLLATACVLSLHAAGAVSPQLAAAVNETDLIQLAGNTHPLALSKFDQGPVSDSLPMEHMLLVLRRSPEQEVLLQQLTAAMHDPNSPNYHHWLTADELGRKFSPAQQDIDAVANWLTSHGFEVNTVQKAGLVIDISGTAGQVRDAFHTEIHNYNVNGEPHIANATDPKIPAALASIVAGFASLNNFMGKPLFVKPDFTVKCSGCPGSFDNATLYLIAPADFATIYHVSPLYAAGITGKGQTIAVLEVSDILSADVKTFRTAFGLSGFTGTFSQIHPGTGCSDPGMLGGDVQIEASLDAEWAGAVAPDADVELASCESTATTGGNLLAAENLINSKTPPRIMSLSFGNCEANLGVSGNQFFKNTWQSADAEGISVFVSSGDGAAAGCDDDASPFAVVGIGANGFGSTPYNVSTGGTDFHDFLQNDISTYWNATNSATGESAKSYVPEIPWDDSCASNLLYEAEGFKNGVAFCNSSTGEDFLDIIGGGGAPSIIYPKPSWQTGTLGIPADGVRDLPDVSLYASNGFYFHALLFCFSEASLGGTSCDYKVPVDAFNNSAGGTSFTAPQFASIQALINQKAKAAQGNPDPIFYQLYKKNTGTLAACNATLGNKISSACIFHDVTIGNNDVPCFGTNDCFGSSPTQYGVLSTSDTTEDVAYPATKGWDFATGLGSVDVTNLVNAWP